MQDFIEIINQDAINLPKIRKNYKFFEVVNGTEMINEAIVFVLVCIKMSKSSLLFSLFKIVNY